MVKIICGYNGCAYVYKDYIIKKFNGPLPKHEIEFGEWISKMKKHSLSLIPLLEYREEQGLTHVPTPPNFNLWPPRAKKSWEKKNLKGSIHHEIKYPRLHKTLAEKYFKIDRMTSYEIAIDFLKTIKIMAEYGFYNPDIHAKNTMIDKNGKWFMIDYGEIRTNPKFYDWSIIAILVMLGPMPDFSVYPDTDKPIYDNFKIISRKLKRDPFYLSEIRSLLPLDIKDKTSHYDIAIEIYWLLDFQGASKLTGFDKWIENKDEKFIKKYGTPHERGLNVDDIIFAYQNIQDINKIIKRFKMAASKL